MCGVCAVYSLRWWRQGPGNQKSTIMPWPKMAAGVGKTVVPMVGWPNGLSASLVNLRPLQIPRIKMFTLRDNGDGHDNHYYIDTVVILIRFFFFSLLGSYYSR